MAEERKTTDPSRVEDGPSISSEHWHGTSVTVAIVAFIFVVITAVYIVSAEEPRDEAFRAQAMAPILLAVGALVTFCTVIWRGLITDAQAKEQRRQNDANERSSFASDLDKGAKNLGEAENEPYQLAGVALLEAVIADPQKRYSVQAMNVLASFFLAAFSKNPKSHAVESARQALNTGAIDLGTTSTVEGHIELLRHPEMYAEGEPMLPDNDALVPAVCGFRHFDITGGRITPANAEILFHRYTQVAGKNTPQTVACKNVKIEKIEIPFGVDFEKCGFIQCKLPRAQPIPRQMMMANFFSGCEFSGAVFLETEMPYFAANYLPGIDPYWLTTSQSGRCWFFEDDPPILIFRGPYSDQAVELQLPWATTLVPRRREKIIPP